MTTSGGTGAAVILAATFAVIAVGRLPWLRVDRTGAALIGAASMLASGAIGFDAAVRAVDARTIVLLFSMMIIVAHLRLAGGFALVTQAVSARVTHPAALLAALVLISGLLSALFLNDTICLVLTPIVIDIAAARRYRPLPFLLALATASNIGSVATITGNPQNILIGSLSGVTFRAFSSTLAPVAAAGLLVDGLAIWWVFRKDLRAQPSRDEPAGRLRPHWPILAKTLVVTTGVVAGFLLGYDTALVALTGAAILLVTRRVRPSKVYRAVDWDLLMLFAGLFVVVGAARQNGLGEWFFERLRPIGVDTVAGLTATAAVLSNVISNVPAVMLFAPAVPLTADPARAWVALAAASTLAGNLTILGSIANLIVVEGARRRGAPVGFVQYASIGVPVTILTLLFSTWWLS